MNDFPRAAAKPVNGSRGENCIINKNERDDAVMQIDMALTQRGWSAEYVIYLTFRYLSTPVHYSIGISAHS